MLSFLGIPSAQVHQDKNNSPAKFCGAIFLLEKLIVRNHTTMLSKMNQEIISAYSDSASANLWPGRGMCGLGAALNEYAGPCGP